MIKIDPVGKILGRYCDECGKTLSDDDYHGYGSWSYTCPKCGYKYDHSIGK